MRYIRGVVAVLWVVVPPVLLSALIHLSDPDIVGWRALTSYSVLWSVMFFGILAAAVAACCLVILVEHGWTAFAIVSGLFAVSCGLVLVVVGSGATTILGLLWSFTGSAALIFVVVVSAVVPAVVFGWPQALTRKGTEPHT